MLMRQSKAFALLLFAALLAPRCAVADQRQPILPKTFGGWNLIAPREVSGAALGGTLGGDFAILVESGLVSAETGTYSRSGGAGAATMEARLYRFRDFAGAYAAYTFLRTPDMSSSDLSEKSAVGHDRILAAVGNLLLDLSAPGAASLSDLKTLVTLLQGQTAYGMYPTMWQYLPGAGFVRTSDHYVLGPAALAKVFPFAPGDWLGFAQGVEAESARYQLSHDSLTLLLARYPTPQLARQELHELETRFGVKQAAAPGETSAAAKTGTPLVYAERRGLMVMMVAGAHDARVARTLVDRVDYETAVTWNEPTWEATEPPFLVMIVNILIATCLLLLYAFIAGLMFAGARLLLKRFAPGKFFDRDHDVELIQLGLGSKPIEAKDFLSLRPPEEATPAPSGSRVSGRN
jgi:Family of unknown function (DUF6599)